MKRGLQNRGDIEYRQRGSLLFTMWQDTKLVFMLSINAQANAEQNVHRRQRDGTSMNIPCPESVRIYNRLMGGVDRGDQLRGYYQHFLVSL